MKTYLLGAGAILFSPVRASADVGDGGCWYGWGHMMGPGFGGIFMWILLLIVIILIGYFLVRASRGGTLVPPPHETPPDILKKRYARGEITREQFDEMMKDLKE